MFSDVTLLSSPDILRLSSRTINAVVGKDPTLNVVELLASGLLAVPSTEESEPAQPKARFRGLLQAFQP